MEQQKALEVVIRFQVCIFDILNTALVRYRARRNGL